MSNRNPLILANLVRNWCDQAPDKKILTFVEVGDGGEFLDETRTYQQLWDNGQRLAAWLREQGLEIYVQSESPTMRMAWVETPDKVRVELMQPIE